MTPQEQKEAALAQVRAVWEDQEATINGRTYKFHRMQHIERRKVFAFSTSIQRNMNEKDFSFLEWSTFVPVEDVMWKNISFNGELICKRRDHWEEYPEDYMQLVSVAMGVMSFPFIRAAGIASASQAAQAPTTSLSKPM